MISVIILVVQVQGNEYRPLVNNDPVNTTIDYWEAYHTCRCCFHKQLHVLLFFQFAGNKTFSTSSHKA